MEDLTVSLVQMQAKVGDIETNLQKIRRFAQQAAREHADIICFPELSVTGYDLERSASFAEDMDGESVRALTEIARSNQLTLLAGMAERRQGGKPFITQLVINASGAVYSYRKTHLGSAEQAVFAPGDGLFTQQTPKAIIGTALCWEMHFPEIAAAMALDGAEIIFAPHASPKVVGDRKELWMRYMPARAYDNSAFAAVCNLLGDNGQGVCFGGGLLLLDPKGKILAEDFSGQESMLTTKLSAAAINRIRTSDCRATMRDTFYLKYRRPELYHR